MVFTPKSLLRHPQVVSPLKEFTSGNFQTLIEDSSIDVKKAKKLVFCAGKFYYDLLKEREERGIKDVALVRLEQLFPYRLMKLKRR